MNWPANVERIEHVPPAEHPAFYGASRFTLNVTRAAMIAAGYSPSVRLFEAAACAVPILSATIGPGSTSCLSRVGRSFCRKTPKRCLAILERFGETDRRALGAAARARVLEGHTATHRASELERWIASATRRDPERRLREHA